MKLNLSLYGILERRYLSTPLNKALEQVCNAGITAIQVREKSVPDREFYEVAYKVKDTIKKYDVHLIINDRVDIALAIDADGVHIGKEDLPLSVARKIFSGYIGTSVHSLNEALEDESAGADYLGVGPIFPSRTKPAEYTVSLDELRKIKESVRIPVVAIGGINKENVSKVLETGIDGIAISYALFSGNVKENAEIFRKGVKNYVSD